ncbi:hypothetical protein QBC98_004873 [Kitasatospora acidiphila]
MGEMFACAGCDCPLTVPLSQVALPVLAHQSYGRERWLPPLMAAGTYAVDSEPWGPPGRPWRELGEGEAVARGLFAPVHFLSEGARGTFVMAPGDACDTVLTPESSRSACCGVDGGEGPNLRCASCGAPVGTRIDDCDRWQEVRLAREAVRRTPVDGPADRALDWEALVQETNRTPPIAPGGFWDSHWEAAAGEALAHLVAASGGEAVAVPDGLIAEMFRRPLGKLLPAPPAKTLALAGPGLPVRDPVPDLLLVPRHPQTGNVWQPPGGTATVPLSADVWIHLAFHNDRLLIPVTGRLPELVLRDEPLPLRPRQLFEPDRGVFLYTLARLPAVREPWLRRIYDRVGGSGPYPGRF